MTHKALVTLGTDGLSDYIRLSDGTKYMLGAVSPLRFVVETVSSSFIARKALDLFLSTGQAMFSADVDRMWELLKPKRARWSAFATPLIPYSDRRTTEPRNSSIRDQNREARTMASEADQFTKDSIQNQIGRIESQIALISEHAKEASPGSISSTTMKNELQGLKDLAAWLRRPSPYGNQSDNSTYYGLPNQGPGGIKAANEQPVPSYEHFKAHTQMVSDIVQAVGETTAKIDQLVTAGKKFDATRARQDLHKIASTATEIMRNVDLAQPWVKNDLTKLAKDAEHIHGLFANAKV